MFRINIIVSTVIFGAALTITVLDNEEVLDRITRTFGAFMGFGVLVLGSFIFFATRELIFQVISAAKNVGKQYNIVLVRKLTVSGRVIAFCFTSYSVVTFLSVIRNDIYSKYDAKLDAVIKASDLLSFMVIVYMYSESKTPPKPKMLSHWRTRNYGTKYSGETIQASTSSKESSGYMYTVKVGKTTNQITVGLTKEQVDELRARFAPSGVAPE